MEFVDGETLAQILARIKDAETETDTPFGKKDDVAYFGNLARAFADVADGLQHAHSKGVTHRDIKPSNLILDQDGRLRILDFGLARLEGQESLTLSGDFVGTLLYMSSEQARRKKIPVDHRTDVYSLDATVYEAICGRPPFRGKDYADTLSQIIERDPVEPCHCRPEVHPRSRTTLTHSRSALNEDPVTVAGEDGGNEAGSSGHGGVGQFVRRRGSILTGNDSPRRTNPRVPRDLKTIVLKCLRKETGDRYGTAEALGQDLRRFVRGTRSRRDRNRAVLCCSAK